MSIDEITNWEDQLKSIVEGLNDNQKDQLLKMLEKDKMRRVHKNWKENLLNTISNKSLDKNTRKTLDELRENNLIKLENNIEWSDWIKWTKITIDLQNGWNNYVMFLPDENKSKFGWFIANEDKFLQFLEGKWITNTPLETIIIYLFNDRLWNKHWFEDKNSWSRLSEMRLLNDNERLR